MCEEELRIERYNVTVFNAIGESPIIELLQYISENYTCGETLCFNEHGGEVVRSYYILLLAHNASGFDNWIVLKSLDRETKNIKIIKISRGLIFISFRCGVKLDGDMRNSLNSHVLNPILKALKANREN